MELPEFNKAGMGNFLPVAATCPPAAFAAYRTRGPTSPWIGLLGRAKVRRLLSVMWTLRHTNHVFRRSKYEMKLEGSHRSPVTRLGDGQRFGQMPTLSPKQTDALALQGGR